jgi:hypothetical protein
MKTKNVLNKKLTLHKKTIANLDKHELREVNGGWTGPSEVTVCMTNCVSGCPICEGTYRECPTGVYTCATCVTCDSCNPCI